MLRRLPIRLRMTLAFGLASAALFGAVGFGVYLTVAAALLDGIDSGLQARAATVGAATEPAPSVTPDPRLAEPGEVLTQVFSAEGRLLAGPPSSAVGVLSADLVAQVRGPTVYERRIPGIANVTRLLAVPARVGGRPAVVVVGSSMQDRADTLHLLAGFLGAAEPVALLVACAAGWRVSGTALGPVDLMRREAAAVAVSGLDRRLSVPPGADEITRLAHTLNDMLDHLERSFRAERRFLDTASHELRTPLATLRTELDLALARPRSLAETRAALVSVSEETDRLARLADDLLVLSRANQGRVRLHRNTMTLSALISAAVGHRWAARSAAAGVGLVVEADDVPVRVDPMRLRQALDNLLDNGLRHSPTGGVLAVRAYAEDGTARIVVTDDGPGFAEGAATADPRPWPGGAGPQAGGLGLAIVRAVIEAHGGHLTIGTRSGGGAQVVLSFPVGDGEGAHNAGQDSTSTRNKASVPPRTARSDTSPMPRT